MENFLYINGITQGFFAPRGYYRSPEGAKSTEELIATGVNFVALVVNQFQETVGSTRIFPDNRLTVDDDELIFQIKCLQNAGIRVMLKPMIDPFDSLWRGFIAHYRGNTFADIYTDNAAKWFESYRVMLCRYADVAEAAGCEMYCIGCELDGMERWNREKWEETIRQVRKHYSGLVTYNLNRNITDLEDDRKWLAMLDIVGVSGYYEVVPADRSSTLDEMIEGWIPFRDKLEKFSKWIGKPVFFAETGTRPVAGAGGITGNFGMKSSVYSPQEQADYFTAMHTVLKDDPWFYGLVWWKHDEFQYRPQYYLPDGNYVGCEPTPLLRQRMKDLGNSVLPPKAAIYPEK